MCADELSDPGRRRQAGPGRARPGREGGGPRPARRRHGGHLHRPAPDAGADRGDRDPGGRRRGRPVRALRRAHDAVPAGAGAARASGTPATSWSSAAASSRTPTSPSWSSSASRRSSRRAPPPQSIVEWVRANVAAAGRPDASADTADAYRIQAHRGEAGRTPHTSGPSMHDAPPPPLDRQGIGRLCRRRAVSALRHQTQRRRPRRGYASRGNIAGRLSRAGVRTAHAPAVHYGTPRTRSVAGGAGLARLRPDGLCQLMPGVELVRDAGGGATARRGDGTGRAIVDLYEYQGRDLFDRHGLPVLGGGVADDPGGGPRDRRAPRRPGRRQGAGEGRRPGQGRRRQARRGRRRGGGPRHRHPRHGHQGPHRPQGDGHR